VKIIKIVLALIVFGVLIFIHELGHYLTARMFKVAIKEFSIGMGPKLISRPSKKTGIVYSVRALPIGGFVSMVGEDEESFDENALNRKPVWQRMIINVAGAFMNLLLGVLIMSVLVVSSPSLGSTTISRFTGANALSEQSGLKVGDTITKVGKTNVHISYDLVYEIMQKGTEPLDITVIRNGEKTVIEDVVFPTMSDSGVLFGKADFKVTTEDKTIVSVAKHAFYQSFASIKLIWQSLIDLVTGKYGVEQMSGPVGVTTAIGEAVDSGSTDLAYLAALISLNLGIFNLLPIPALDGGRLVFLIIELIRRKPIKPTYEAYVHFVGIVVLMLLMLFVTYNDIVKLFTK